MPAPEILYRIVEYREDDRIFNVIVVIHNSIKIISSKERICDVQDEILSWNDMKITNPQFAYPYSKLVYACPVTEDTIKKLQADYKVKTSTSPFVLDANKRNKIKANNGTLCSKELVEYIGTRMLYERVFL